MVSCLRNSSSKKKIWIFSWKTTKINFKMFIRLWYTNYDWKTKVCKTVWKNWLGPFDLFFAVCAFCTVCGNFFVKLSTEMLHEVIYFYLFSGCTIYAIIATQSGIGSIVSMTVIAYDRYVMITSPMRSLYLGTKMRSAKMVLFTWLYTALFSVIPLMGFSDGFMQNGKLRGRARGGGGDWQGVGEKEGAWLKLN